MALAKSSLSKVIFLKSSSFTLFGTSSKCLNHNWCTLATLKLIKPKFKYNIFSSNSFKKNKLKFSFVCNKQFPYTNSIWPVLTNQSIRFSSSVPNQTDGKKPQLSKKDILKRAVKEYGSTVIIFHVAISLVSLGIAYLAVTSGLDVQDLLAKAGLRNHTTEAVPSRTNMLGTTGDVAAEFGPFVIAYAIHKVFAPARISITLFCTPFIVRHLRKIGFLKPPKPSST